MPARVTAEGPSSSAASQRIKICCTGSSPLARAVHRQAHIWGTILSCQRGRASCVVTSSYRFGGRVHSAGAGLLVLAVSTSIEPRAALRCVYPNERCSAQILP